MCNDHLDFAKKEILNDFVLKGKGAGYAHHPSFRFQVDTQWSPAQRSCYGEALDVLVIEGSLEQRKETYYLTHKGEQAAYGNQR